MLIQTTDEMRQLTGNYYANNDFEKVMGEMDLATDELAKIVGQAVIERAERREIEDAELLTKVQRPIALLAALRMYQKNDLSHEDDGRKVKMSTDDSEKIPWEWQLDRDDALQLESYYRATDALIRFLESKSIPEWTESPNYKERQALIIRSGEDFDRYFPIEKSERTYLLLLPAIREAQRMTVSGAYGPKWQELLADTTIPESDVHYAACMAVALLALSITLRRTPLSLIPGGVVRGYLSRNGMTNTQPASLQDVDKVASWMSEDAADWVAKMQRARDGGEANYTLMPSNDPRNKYCRL